MLPLSRKPQILRLHQLQQSQRHRYINQFTNSTQQFLPNSLSSLTPFLPLLADIYYTYITICKCKRRLGEQYTYVAMYNAKHYQQQGVLVNQNTRLLMFVLQITQRHLIKNLVMKMWSKLENKIQEGGKWKIFRDFVSIGVQGFFQQGKLFMLMLFLLGWNKHFNLVDTILKNQYVYTYMNKNTTPVDYRIEGYMLLVVFVVKLLRFSVHTYKILNEKKKKVKPIKSQQKSEQQKLDDNESQLCRICYDTIKNKSVTCCGHVFCWDCLLKYLNNHPQCPVCRTECQPKEVIQLQNF